MAGVGCWTLRELPLGVPIPALDLTYKGEEIYPKSQGRHSSDCRSLVSFCPLELDQGPPSLGERGVAPFQSYPSAYPWDTALEADTDQTWNPL